MQNLNDVWQDYRPRDRMEYLLNTGHLSDCSFLVHDYEDGGNKIIFKCHKFILMISSPVFERMFEGDFEEGKSPDNILLDDVSASDFKKFIEYLYWYDNRVLESYDLQTLQSMIYLSKKFMVSSVTTKCLNIIKHRLNSNDFDEDITIDLFHYAHQIEDKELLSTIKYKIIASPVKYIAAAASIDLNYTLFLEFTELLKNHVSDKLRFDVIERYCKTHSLNTNTEQYHLSMQNMFQNDIPNLNGSVDMQIVENCLLQNERNQNDNLNNDNNNNDNNNVNQLDQNEIGTDEQSNVYTKKLLKSITFTTMNAHEFCSGPGTSKLLSIEKKFEILCSICIAEYKERLLFES